MAHGYRTLQHWNQWLSQQLMGTVLLNAEQQALAMLMERHFGKHAMLIGVPEQSSLLQNTSIPIHTLLSPITAGGVEKYFVEADLDELPIHTGSIDLVILPHTLEFVDNPRQLLNEACRIVKPEGLIIISGFNPYSLWGLFRLFIQNKRSFPKDVNYVHSRDLKNWLRLADFEIEDHVSTLFRPPLAQMNFFESLNFIEKIGPKLFPVLGGVYLVVARAKVIPLTPIKMKWKQRISDIRISTTIPGQMASKLVNRRQS